VPLCTAIAPPWPQTGKVEKKSVLRLAVTCLLLAAVCACAGQLPAFIPPGGGAISSGTILKVVLADAVSTDSSTPGDYFSGALAEPVVVDGRTLLEKGTEVRGRVFDLREPRQSNGGALLHLVLTEIVHEGKTITIATNHFVATNNDAFVGTRGRDIHLKINTRIDFVLATPIEI
jgi:hypothetical protein